MFKQIREDIREIGEYISQAWTTITSTTKIRLLIYMANIMQKTYNRRFFVSIIVTPRGERLKIFDKYMFNQYKRKRWLPKRMTTLDLVQKCFYATPLSSNNNISKDERKKATRKYVRYVKSMRTIRVLSGRSSRVGRRA